MKEQTEVFIICCCCCWCVKEAHPIWAATTFSAIRNNGVLKWTGGLVQCLELWMLGKDFGCGKKRRERIMNFQQIAEKHMKKSLWRLLSVSLCLFHSLIFSPPSLLFFLNLYLEVFYFCGFHDFFLETSAYIFICPLCQSLILQTETLSLQCSIIYSSLFSQFFFLLSMCKMSHRETAFIPTCIAGLNWATFQNK